MIKQRSNLQKRLDTLRAAAVLVTARALVRFVPLTRWRAALGAETTAVSESTGKPGQPDANARYWADRVERAAHRLPGTSKCLPQAVALQWLLARLAIPSRLVIASHRIETCGEHYLHAWTESRGHMLIGRCDRASYRIIVAFEHAG